MRNACINRPSSRSGLSLIEVLVSMFVLAVGLLGVASLLPVGQFQIARGEEQEEALLVGRAALAQIEAGGWLNPARWYDGAGKHFVPINPATESQVVFEVTGFSPSATAPTSVSQIEGQVPGATSLDNISSRGYASQAGSVVVFRSGPLRGHQIPITSHDGSSLTFDVQSFNVPANTNINGSAFIIQRRQPFAIDPLFVAAQGSNNFAGVGTSMPMARIQISQGALVGPMTPAMAEYASIWNGDLSFILRDDPTTTTRDESDEPRQLWYGENGGTTPLKRKSAGAYSWLATATNGGVSAKTYRVSVAVFRNRLVRGTPGLTDDSLNVGLTFNGGGYGGGAATMTGADTVLEKAKAGEWIMIWNTSNPTRAYYWYEIINLEPVTGTGSRRVTLSGPDWTFGAAAAKILPGCIGVFEKQTETQTLPEY